MSTAKGSFPSNHGLTVCRSVEHARRFKAFREISGRLRVKKQKHVPGEHDAALDGGVLFRENFGETHYSFDHGQEVRIQSEADHAQTR